MKTGILTFHYAHNYGAVLQAYALREAVKKLGHECHILNYRNRNIQASYERTLRTKRVFYLTRHLSPLVSNWKWNRDIPFMRESWEKQHDEFERFSGSFITEHESGTYYDVAELVRKVEGESFDAIIAGSDQIWNKSLTGGFDPVYFLDFPYSGRKISYAASTGSGSLSPEYEEYLRKVLRPFSAVSLREESIASDISRKLGINAEAVLDPSLLLEQNEYSPLMCKERLTDKPFVFVYFVAEDMRLSEFSRELAKKMSCGVIELHYYKRRCLMGSNQIADIGPDKFLWYVRNAEAVCSNSFHGTAFSIIFRKNFYCVSRPNARIDDLLGRLGISGHHVQDITQIFPSGIDYRDVEPRLSECREKSSEFLRKALS